MMPGNKISTFYRAGNNPMTATLRKTTRMYS